jgi:hypothetical protein
MLLGRARVSKLLQLCLAKTLSVPEINSLHNFLNRKTVLALVTPKRNSEEYKLIGRLQTCGACY